MGYVNDRRLQPRRAAASIDDQVHHLPHLKRHFRRRDRRGRACAVGARPRDRLTQVAHHASHEAVIRYPQGYRVLTGQRQAPVRSLLPHHDRQRAGPEAGGQRLRQRRDLCHQGRVRGIGEEKRHRFVRRAPLYGEQSAYGRVIARHGADPVHGICGEANEPAVTQHIHRLVHAGSILATEYLHPGQPGENLNTALNHPTGPQRLTHLRA